jgi:hypothetical protein
MKNSNEKQPYFTKVVDCSQASQVPAIVLRKFGSVLSFYTYRIHSFSNNIFGSISFTILFELKPCPSIKGLDWKESLRTKRHSCGCIPKWVKKDFEGRNFYQIACACGIQTKFEHDVIKVKRSWDYGDVINEKTEPKVDVQPNIYNGESPQFLDRKFGI